MSVVYDEAQQAIGDAARRALAAQADRQRQLAALEQVGAFDLQFHEIAARQGWLAMALPEAHGGLGLGLIEQGIVAQACGGVIAGTPLLATNAGVAQAIIAGGDAALAGRWLRRLGAGDAKGAVAFAEAEAMLPDTAATQWDGTTLTGSKQGVPAGLVADVALVWASRDGEPVLALADLAGASRTAIDSFDNGRLHADLIFAATPATALAQGEAARALALDLLARMATITAHEQTGGAEALLWIARDYALARKAFGQPIGAFQSVKHRIAELYALVEIARANCIHAASREGQPDFLLAAAAARLSAGEAYDTAARDCVQIHGGFGVTWEGGLHLHMRRARSLAIELGHALFWEDIAVDELVGGVLVGSRA